VNRDEINGPLSGRAQRHRQQHCQRYPRVKGSPPHRGTPVSSIRTSRGLVTPVLLIAEGNRLPVKGNVAHLEAQQDDEKEDRTEGAAFGLPTALALLTARA
jgi:hypothetical protein